MSELLRTHPMLSPQCIWMRGEERLADLGALLNFRHWLRQQLEELAAESDAMLSGQEPGLGETSYGRLYF